MQFDSYPTLPSCMAFSPSTCLPGTFPGQLVDLTSFNLPNTTTNSSVIGTAFGYDTPRRSNEPRLGPGWDGVYDFHGAGPLNRTMNSWEIVAWGEDENGDRWWVLYETPATGSNPQPAAISVESRVETGPTESVLTGVKVRLKALGNKELSKMVDEIVSVAIDGRRTEQSPVICSTACQQNEGLVA